MQHLLQLLLNVKICLDQPIAVSPGEAQEAFLDASFYNALGDLEGISAPELRSLEMAEGHARAVVGYKFAGHLGGPAAAILDPAKLTWTQVSDVDLARRRTEVRMVADNYGGLLSFSGWYELWEGENDSCCQHFEADLRVYIPLLGPLAERALAMSVVQNIKETAELLEHFVVRRRELGQQPEVGQERGVGQGHSLGQEAAGPHGSGGRGEARTESPA